MANSTATAAALDTEFTRGLGLYDSTMVVVGSMIGSGIFIVSADMARTVGGAGWLLVAWLLTGALTIVGALSYGELAAMMPRAGGQYVYLREAFSPLWGFLYGWTLFLVIQTGTIAAVAVGFARYFGVLVAVDRRGSLPDPAAPPLDRLRAVAVDDATGRRPDDRAAHLDQHAGLEYGRIVQNVFTTAKTGALLGLIVVGLLLGWNHDRGRRQLRQPLGAARRSVDIVPGLNATSAFGLFVAICVAQTGSLFSADAWNNITFTAGEVKDPRRNIPLSLALGTVVVIGAVPAGQRRLPRDAAVRRASSMRRATASPPRR